MTAPPAPAGLCDACRHQRVVTTGRGSRFSLCGRHRDDPAYAKYPRLPVLRCPGFEPRGEGVVEVEANSGP